MRREEGRGAVGRREEGRGAGGKREERQARLDVDRAKHSIITILGGRHAPFSHTPSRGTHERHSVLDKTHVRKRGRE